MACEEIPSRIKAHFLACHFQVLGGLQWCSWRGAPQSSHERRHGRAFRNAASAQHTNQGRSYANTSGGTEWVKRENIWHIYFVFLIPCIVGVDLILFDFSNFFVHQIQRRRLLNVVGVQS
jgi:hypothetical protein